MPVPIGPAMAGSDHDWGSLRVGAAAKTSIARSLAARICLRSSRTESSSSNFFMPCVANRAIAVRRLESSWSVSLSQRSGGTVPSGREPRGSGTVVKPSLGGYEDDHARTRQETQPMEAALKLKAATEFRGEPVELLLNDR